MAYLSQVRRYTTSMGRWQILKMRLIIIATVLTLSFACNNDVEVREKTEVPKAVDNNKVDTVKIRQTVNRNLNLKPFTEEDIKLIKENSILAQYSLNIPRYDSKLNQIPKYFLEDYIYGLVVSEPDFVLPEDAPMFYKFNEYKELDNHHLFTIIYLDESCCRINYGLTISKQTNKIVDVDLLGLIGGDGGWSESDLGIWTSDTTLEVVKASSYDEDIFDEKTMAFRREIDTSWVVIKIDRHGLFLTSVVDSMKIDTIIRN